MSDYYDEASSGYNKEMNHESYKFNKYILIYVKENMSSVQAGGINYILEQLQYKNKYLKYKHKYNKLKNI